jgi:hypothetical protein
MIDKGVLDRIPRDKILGPDYIIRHYNKFDSQTTGSEMYAAYHDYLSYYLWAKTFIKLFNIEIGIPELGKETENNVQSIRSFFSGWKNHIDHEIVKGIVERESELYEKIMNGNALVYEFSQGDYDQIQGLLNQLRSLISSSELFENDHKMRLLNKLENLQREIHKTMSTLDSFWSLVGDAGIALGKFGEDAKPFVDRIADIMKIVWSTQARAAELPSNTPIPKIDE